MASRELHRAALALCHLNGLDPDQQPGFAGIGRIYRSRGRVGGTGSNASPSMTSKFLNGCGGKISPLPWSDPAPSGGSGKSGTLLLKSRSLFKESDHLKRDPAFSA
jgi:hypothetical protein